MFTIFFRYFEDTQGSRAITEGGEGNPIVTIILEGQSNSTPMQFKVLETRQGFEGGQDNPGF